MWMPSINVRSVWTNRNKITHDAEALNAKLVSRWIQEAVSETCAMASCAAVRFRVRCVATETDLAAHLCAN